MSVRLTYLSLLLTLVTAVVLTTADNGNGTYDANNMLEITTVSTLDHTPKSETANSPFAFYSGIISECLVKFSYLCFQRKLIIFLDRLDKQRKISIYGDWIELIRVSEHVAPPITEDMLIARKAIDVETLSSLLNLAWERFVDNRNVRIYLPTLEDTSLYEGRSQNYLDVNITGYTSGDFEGRLKKKKKKKLAKILKKAFLIVGKLVVVKLILLKPIILKLLLLKALMALGMGKMGFMMSMGMMLMKMMQSKGFKRLIGRGGCNCGGGKGGWKQGGCGCDGDGYAPSGVSDAAWNSGGGGGGWDSSGGGGGGGSGGGGWMSGGGGGGGYDRSFSSHDAAYSYYIPGAYNNPTKGNADSLAATNSTHDTDQTVET